MASLLHMPPTLPMLAALLHRVEAAARFAVAWLSVHTGIPALVVAAILVVVGWRLLKKSARLAVEIALVTALLLAATQAGWLRW